jgi:hypothetical protein
MIQVAVFEDMIQSFRRTGQTAGAELRVTSSRVTRLNIAGYLLKLQMTKVTNLARA